MPNEVNSEELAAASKTKRADLLVSNLYEALRQGERNLILCLLSATTSVAVANGADPTLTFPYINLKVTTSAVWAVSVFVSWCIAWFTFSTNRHARELTKALQLEEPDIASVALTFPSLFTIGASWLRRLIVVACALLAIMSMWLTFLQTVSYWWIVGFCLLLLPYLVLLIGSWKNVNTITYRPTRTEPSALLSPRHQGQG
jgi:hypothetical protein